MPYRVWLVVDRPRANGEVDRSRVLWGSYPDRLQADDAQVAALAYAREQNSRESNLSKWPWKAEYAVEAD